MKARTIKKMIGIGVCAFICIIIILAAIGYVRPIFPGKDVEILYPEDYAVVPRDFPVYCVATRWYFGLEVTPLLFLSPPESHVRIHSPFATVSVDGDRYAVSTEGNHHLVWMSLPEGDHIIRLDAIGETKEIHVRTAKYPDVVFKPFDSVDDVAEATDRLESALFEYIASMPPGQRGKYQFRRIFLTGDGAFIAYYDMRDRVLSGCEITYLDLSGDPPWVEEIAAAPALFTWTEDAAQRPVIAGALETGGDRLFFVVLDDANLTVFSVFPDGAVATDNFSYEDVLPELSASIAENMPPEITTHGLGAFLHVGLTVYHPDGSPGEAALLVSGSTARVIDVGGYFVEGIYPDGKLIACYPASVTNPCTTLLYDETGPIDAYFPLPHVEDFLSFTGGSVHETNRFYPECPRFEIAPVVPYAGGTDGYDPTYFVTAGDVTFPPDVVRVSIAGIEGYYVMKAGGR